MELKKLQAKIEAAEVRLQELEKKESLGNSEKFERVDLRHFLNQEQMRGVYKAIHILNQRADYVTWAVTAKEDEPKPRACDVVVAHMLPLLGNEQLEKLAATVAAEMLPQYVGTKHTSLIVLVGKVFWTHMFGRAATLANHGKRSDDIDILDVVFPWACPRGELYLRAILLNLLALLKFENVGVAVATTEKDGVYELQMRLYSTDSVAAPAEPKIFKQVAAAVEAGSDKDAIAKLVADRPVGVDEDGVALLGARMADAKATGLAHSVEQGHQYGEAEAIAAAEKAALAEQDAEAAKNDPDAMAYVNAPIVIQNE